MATTLAQKLQLQSSLPLLLVNAPQGYEQSLETELPDNPLTSFSSSESVNALLLFVNNLDEARSLAPQSIQQMDADGLLWIAYPKGSSKVKTDVNRNTLWQALASTGWRPVRQIALDETWSAMRFRPESKVSGD